jgi:hypothetical protein
MRTAVKWLAFAAVPAFASACFSSSAGPSTADSATEPDDGGTSDAPAQPGPEGSTPDAAPSDASPDAPSDAGGVADVSADTYVAEAAAADAAPDMQAPPVPVVTVVVASALGPEQGVPVVFDDGYGQVLATGTTDALGRASAAVPAGSQVTALMGPVTAPQISTIQGVAPPDVLSFYDTSNDTSGNWPDVHVAFAADAGPPPGTSDVRASIGDCNVSIPGDVTLSPECISASGAFPVLAIAQAGADGGYADLAYTFSKGNTLAPQDGVTNITLPGPWYTDMGYQTVGEINPPSSSSGYSDLSLIAIASNVPTRASNSQDSVYYNQTPTAQFPIYPEYYDALQAEGNVSVYEDFGLSVAGIATRGLGDAGTTTFDLSQGLPLIDSVAVDTTIPSRPILTWGASAGSLASADGIVAQITWQDGDTSGSWTILAPGTATSITAPAVSGLAAQWVPSATASVATPILFIVDADFITSYAELRTQASVFQITPNLYQGATGQNDAPMLPVDGTLRYTAVTVNGD